MHCPSVPCGTCGGRLRRVTSRRCIDNSFYYLIPIVLHHSIAIKIQNLPARKVFTCYIQFALSNDLDHTLRRPTQSSDRIQHLHFRRLYLDSSWNVMAHGAAREGKWRGNWRIEWVASSLHTTSEHGVSSITTADAHTSAASSLLNWRPPPI